MVFRTSVNEFTGWVIYDVMQKNSMTFFMNQYTKSQENVDS